MGLVQSYPALKRVDDPLCSICIANYNGIDLLADCLDSVLAQAPGFAFEIIVHDDASTDASVEFLRARYPMVEILASTENVGFCASNNRMADIGRGKYFLFLNNDAALLPGALAVMAEAAATAADGGIFTLPQFDWTTNQLVDRGCLLDPFYNPVPNLDPARADVAMVIGACLWIDRDSWHALGGFPTWLESIAEDMYLCCAARLRSKQVRALTASGYRHRQGASFGGGKSRGGRLDTTFKRRRLSERNKTLVLAIMTPGLFAAGLLALHLATLAIEGVLVSILLGDAKILSGIYAPAIAAPFRQWRQVRTSRALMQSTRSASVGAYFHAFTAWPRKLVMLRRFGLPRIRR